MIEKERERVTERQMGCVGWAKHRPFGKEAGLLYKRNGIQTWKDEATLFVLN